MSLGPGGAPVTTPSAPAGFDFQLRPTGGDDGSGPSRRTRRRSVVDHRAATSVVLVVTLAVVALAAAGGTAWFLVQQAESEVRADSAAFCADLATTPGVLDTDGYGWPADAATQEEAIVSIRAYADRWNNLAVVGPPTIRADLARIGTVAAQTADSIETTKTNDRAGNLERIRTVVTRTNVKPWATKYCS